jgi:tight adherence protein C
VTPILLAAALAFSVLMVFVGLSRTPDQADTGQLVDERLQTYGGTKPLTIQEAELAVPFAERFLRPLMLRVGSVLSRSTPAKARQALMDQLELAGRPGNLTPEDFGALRIVGAAVGALIGLLLGLLTGSPVYFVVTLAVGAGLGYYMPLIWLRQKVDGRRAEIQKSLPDAMDLMVIAVDAGLGFDAALTRVVEKYKNALSVELGAMLREILLGRPRVEAMDDLGRRTGVEDLHNFIQAVIQSEQFGTPVGKILRLQADEMRRKRRQRAQEKAAQATLKMMLPMVGCIFPTLWIVLLGPAILILINRPKA